MHELRKDREYYIVRSGQKVNRKHIISVAKDTSKRDKANGVPKDEPVNPSTSATTADGSLEEIKPSVSPPLYPAHLPS